MRRRNANREEPKWAKGLSDLETVEKFKTLISRNTFTYEAIGRKVVDMRKRLLTILVDGLAAQRANGEDVWTTWFLIESAPKDGELFLACEGEYVHLAYWDREEAEEGGHCYRRYDPDNERTEATHWMPLPAPMKVQKRSTVDY